MRSKLLYLLISIVLYIPSLDFSLNYRYSYIKRSIETISSNIKVRIPINLKH